jgi:signal transduction histidine kinase
MIRRSLTFRLLLLSAAAATIPAVVISFVLHAISTRALESSIRDNQKEIAHRVADGVDNEILLAQRMLGFVARMPDTVMGNVPETQRALQNLMHALPSVQEVMEISEFGVERFKVTRRGSSSRLFKRNINTKLRFIGPPFFSNDRLPTVLITEPIPSSRRGALVIKMSFSTLGTLMQQTRVGQNGMAFVVGHRGDLLAHVDESRVVAHVNVGKLPVVQDWLASPSEPTGLREYTDANGVPVIGLAYPIPLLQSAVVVQQPKADVYAPLRHMRTELIAWTALWVGFFLAVTVFMAWRIQHPLRQLQSAAERVAQGKMDVQLDIQTRDELEDLGKAFSKMTDSLRQLEGLRRDLISMIVHDLKSPLTSILVSFDYLLTGQAGTIPAEQRKFLMLGHRSGTELLMLIQNLLDVAKMEEGKLVLNKQTFSLQEWADEIINSFKPVAEAGKKQLHLDVWENLPPVEADRSLLGRVLGNLLANALRHTPLGTGRVVVTLSRRTEQVCIEVRDNGQGIPQEYQTRIFEKFVQVERKRAHLRTGTGLGLTFCKMVVEAHGGRIFVHSVPEEGSTFTFLLPVNTVPLPAESPSDPAVLTASN